MGGCVPFHEPDNTESEGDTPQKRKKDQYYFISKLNRIEDAVNHPNKAINSDFKKRRFAMLFEAGYG